MIIFKSLITDITFTYEVFENKKNTYSLSILLSSFE